MKLKELLRVLIKTEIMDIAVYEVEADTFGGNPAHGPAIRELFLKLAEKKKERLKTLRRISKGGVGFRQRNTKPEVSIEASLRTHAANAGRSAVLYNDLAKELNKPEYKQAATEISTEERRDLEALRALQTLVKRK